MDVRGADPFDERWRDDFPAYRVTFWTRPGEKIYGEDAMWEAHEHEITGAQDVGEVLGWASENVPHGGTFTLYAVGYDDGELGLVRLAGLDPTVRTWDEPGQPGPPRPFPAPQ